MAGLLQGHIAAVTGGGSGIGQGICQAYAREGARVIVLDTNPAGAKETVDLITTAGGKASAVKLDVTDRAACQSVVHVSWPNSAAYTTSKHGVLGFTRALAAELGKDGVRVNAIGPGLIETKINAEARAKNPDMVAKVMGHTPLGRPGKPEDIAGPAVFLASDMSAYVTGCIIMADGGFRTV